MKTALLFTGSSPLIILTSYDALDHPSLIEKLSGKGIDKFIAYEIPLETARERYGGHFAVVTRDLRETDDLRILDYNGQRAFHLFHLSELGCPIMHEAGV
ncbi:MAG: hypothetical protein JXQ83_07995 [Candidatus Glassbacteria bacterium]|nr:hypothetical protein [Candidatus Glassbacteria bacterium]